MITTNWKILKEMEIPNHLTCFLRNLDKGQEATVRTLQLTGSKLEKRVRQACVFSPCLFNLDAEYITWNSRLNELLAGIKITKRNIKNLSYANDTNLMAESEELWRKTLDEKAGLKINIKKTNIVTGGPITSWQIQRESGISDWFYCLGLDNHCEWWLQKSNWRHSLERKLWQT